MHELRSHVQAIELHDLLEVESAPKTELTITGFEVAKGSDNSVLKAQAALEAAAERALPAAFTLHKRIPPGSGLGGASSDAGAALRALAALYNLKQDLQPIASQVGADVTFFLNGGGALVEGAGERVTPIPSAAEVPAEAAGRNQSSAKASAESPAPHHRTHAARHRPCSPPWRAP